MLRIHSFHLRARHRYCVHMRSPSVCISPVLCCGGSESRGERYDIAERIYDEYLYCRRCVVVQQIKSTLSNLSVLH
jgi:hypothetical protein